MIHVHIGRSLDDSNFFEVNLAGELTFTRFSNGCSGTKEEVVKTQGLRWTGFPVFIHPFPPTSKTQTGSMYSELNYGFLGTSDFSSFFTCTFFLRFFTGFEFVQELPTPRFQFGGQTGNSVTALIFKRVH